MFRIVKDGNNNFWIEEGHINFCSENDAWVWKRMPSTFSTQQRAEYFVEILIASKQITVVKEYK